MKLYNYRDDTADKIIAIAAILAAAMVLLMEYWIG